LGESTELTTTGAPQTLAPVASTRRHATVTAPSAATTTAGLPNDTMVPASLTSRVRVSGCATPGTRAAGAVFTQEGTAVSAGGGDTASFNIDGPPPDGGGKGPLVLDDKDARQGTDAECAAMRPDVQAQP